MVINAQVHVTHLVLFKKRIADSVGHMVADWPDKAFQAVDPTLQGIMMLPPVMAFLALIVVDPGTAEYEAELMIGDAQLVREIHGDTSVAQPSRTS